MYNRYAESARVNWTLNFAASDPQHRVEWLELMTPKSIGLILRSIKTDYKFVSGCTLLLAPFSLSSLPPFCFSFYPLCFLCFASVLLGEWMTRIH